MVSDNSKELKIYYLGRWWYYAGIRDGLVVYRDAAGNEQTFPAPKKEPDDRPK